MIKGEIRAKEMAFDQGVVFMGGYRSCPAVQCGATVTTALTAQPYSAYSFALLLFRFNHSLALSLSSGRYGE